MKKSTYALAKLALAFQVLRKEADFVLGKKLKKNKLLVLNKSSQKTKKQRRFKVRVKKST